MANRKPSYAHLRTAKTNANRAKALRKMVALGWVPGRGWPGGVDPRRDGGKGNGAARPSSPLVVRRLQTSAEAVAEPRRPEPAQDVTSLPSLLQASADGLANIARAIVTAKGIPDARQSEVLRMAIDIYEAVRERDVRK